jgi:hypothetical protein
MAPRKTPRQDYLKSVLLCKTKAHTKNAKYAYTTVLLNQWWCMGQSAGVSPTVIYRSWKYCLQRLRGIYWPQKYLLKTCQRNASATLLQQKWRDHSSGWAMYFEWHKIAYQKWSCAGCNLERENLVDLVQPGGELSSQYCRTGTQFSPSTACGKGQRKMERTSCGLLSHWWVMKRIGEVRWQKIKLVYIKNMGSVTCW